MTAKAPQGDLSFKAQLTLKDYLLQELPITQENVAFWGLFLIIHCLPLKELALSTPKNAIPTQSKLK